MLRSRLGSILRSLIRHRRFESEMTQEVQFHIDRRTDDLMSLEGLSRDEALRRARMEFGSPEKYKEEARQAFGLRWIDELRADIFDFIELFYNSQRRHSHGGGVSTRQFEADYFERL